jgi:ligand-binding sensor domain-containing protein
MGLELVQNKPVNWIRFDSEKDLWIGTQDEIIVYDEGNESIIRFPEHSRSFHEDSKHNFWVATIDKGIAFIANQTVRLCT